MKTRLWLVVASALAVGSLILVVEPEARETVALQVHGGDRVLMAMDLDRLQRDARAVLDTLAGNKDGEVYSAAVEGTNPDHLALAVALVDGRIFSVGDADVRFPLMSVSKPFTYALASGLAQPAFPTTRLRQVRCAARRSRTRWSTPVP
jgi:CubicO group peptidase (beta-lactamase class C family)